MQKLIIQHDNWNIETNEGEVILEHSIRAGNKKDSIIFSSEDFLVLYNLILSLAQIHPEWLNTQ